MKKVFIIHGYGGLPNGGWFPWLSRELAKKEIATISLLMPDTHNPSLVQWMKKINEESKQFDADTILLGHSLGATATLRFLESIPSGTMIGGVVLVSGCISSLQKEKKESIFRKVDAFVEPSINLEKIKKLNIPTIVIHGTDDSVVPFSHAEIISRGLGCTLVTVLGGNHFSQLGDAPCYELPEAFEAVLALLQSTTPNL